MPWVKAERSDVFAEQRRWIDLTLAILGAAGPRRIRAKIARPLRELSLLLILGTADTDRANSLDGRIIVSTTSVGPRSV